MQRFTLRQCGVSLLDDIFGLRKTFSNATLSAWIQTEISLSEQERDTLEKFQELLILNDGVWNEQELSLNFIGPVFALVRFSDPYRYNLFSERKISAVIPSEGGDIELSGEPDGIIATGYRDPKIPMFAFSEYKRELDPNGDPAGQSLAAMLIGQSFDTEAKPLYGCYVVGNAWRFMVLEGKHYAVSVDYSAITDEIYDIFRILKALKLRVIEMTEGATS